jgi:hypothetical protein
MPDTHAPGPAATAAVPLLDAEKLDVQRGLAAATKSLLSGGRDRV